MALGWVCAYQYIQIIGVQCQNACAEMHNGIVAGTIDAPYRYRVLAALLVEGIRRLVSDVPLAYGIAHLMVFPLMFLCLDGWLRTWLSPDRALVGVALVAAYMPLMLQVWGIALYTALEVIFLCLGLILLYRQPRRWQVGFALITVIASFNRETAILLPLVYLSVCRTLRLSLVFGLCWLIPFAAVRLAQGTAPESLSITATWALNTAGGWHTLVAVIKHGLLLPLWLQVGAAGKDAPPALKRLLVPGLLYLGGLASFALWHEVRLLLPLFVLWTPLTLFKAVKGHADEAEVA